MVSKTNFSAILSGQRVRPKIGRRYFLFFKGLLISLVVIFCILILMGPRIQNVNFGYKISKAKEEQTTLKEINKAFKIEIATLKSNEILERNIKKFGIILCEPNQDQIYRIK
ncbi:MAG: hypothetical protein SV062_10350 [Thermodesulfobacteriota bacterium]|nr:hypothetical protein [Thermodesulfobacteriota bacterium]